MALLTSEQRDAKVKSLEAKRDDAKRKAEDYTKSATGWTTKAEDFQAEIDNLKQARVKGNGQAPLFTGNQS